jgi:hypothetical protein
VSDAAVASDTAVIEAAPVRPAASRISRPQRRAAARPATRSTAPRPTGTALIRRRATIPALSFFAVFGIAGGSLVSPFQGVDMASAAVIAPPLREVGPTQSYTAHGTYAETAVDRDSYSIKEPPPVVVTPPPAATTSTTSTASTSTSTAKKSSSTAAPAAGTPDPGSAKAIALDMVTARGWGTDQYNCLVSLWNKESGWNIYAYNPSGAYGIPQSLPGSKMASAGADWQTNPATQITWGLNYITGSYGTPCGAWGHSVSYNWY